MRDLFLTSAVLLLLVCATASCSTWYIEPDGTGDAPTIQAGIDSASAGDTVLVVCGYYSEFNIEMKSGICLRSETGEPDCVMIDVGRMGRAVSCEDVDSTSSIEGLTLTRALYEGDGGGLHCYLSSPVVRKCDFRANSADGDGGGVFCDHSSPQITHCNFYSNDAHNGGGICCVASSPSVTNCSFSWNSADDAGGGIYCDASSPTIVSCTFSLNHANNHACGILSMGSSSVTLENTIIAFGFGSEAVACFDNSSVALTCCDVYSNEGGDWVDCIADQYSVNGNFYANPRFCDPDNGDYHLYACSPCVHKPGCGLVGAFGVGCGRYDHRMAQDIPSGPLKGSVEPEAPLAACLDLSCSVKEPGRVEMRYSIPSVGRVRLMVHDVEGRVIRTLMDRTGTAGTHSLMWDCFNDYGKRISPGIYFAQLWTPREVLTRKVVLVR